MSRTDALALGSTGVPKRSGEMRRGASRRSVENLIFSEQNGVKRGKKPPGKILAKELKSSCYIF